MTGGDPAGGRGYSGIYQGRSQVTIFFRDFGQIINILFWGTLPHAAGPTPLLVQPIGPTPAQYSLQPLDRVHHRKGAATGIKL